MKTFTDLFPDESADINDTPRQTIKASLRTAMADNGPRTRLAHAGNNEEDLSESDQKSSEAAADKRTRNLRRYFHTAGTSHDRAGSMSF